MLGGIKVLVGNDANVAALGEIWMGAAKGCRSAVMVTLGTGVGGGVIVNGKVIDGTDVYKRQIALRAGRNLQEKLFSLPADAPCAEAVDTADGSWKRTVSSKGAGSVTALCPVESLSLIHI